MAHMNNKLKEKDGWDNIETPIYLIWWTGIEFKDKHYTPTPDAKRYVILTKEKTTVSKFVENYKGYGIKELVMNSGGENPTKHWIAKLHGVELQVALSYSQIYDLNNVIRNDEGDLVCITKVG